MTFIDARTLPDGHVVTTTVCIIGAGPAGLTVAGELARRDVALCVVESGGMEPDAAAQSLCDGETVGDGDQQLGATRRRQFGGTSNDWQIELGDGTTGVRWTRLTPADFVSRGWAPHTGWPFGSEHLSPYYERAREVCGLGPAVSVAGHPASVTNGASTAVGPQGLVFPSGRVESTAFEIGRADVFATTHRDRLAGHPGARVLLHANVLELESAGAGAAVARAHIGCLTGTRLTVEAQVFVIAGGAVENARLLLLSNRDQPRGLGNEHDLVGRYFMDHSLDYSDRFRPASPSLFRDGTFFDVHKVGSRWAMGRLTIAQETLEREPVLNVAVHLLPRHRTHGPLAVEVLKAARRGTLDDVPLRNVDASVRTVIGGAATVVERVARRLRHVDDDVPVLSRGGWSASAPDPEHRFGYFELATQIEQLPNPANRVRLDGSRDRLGQPRARLEWHWSDLEVTAWQRTRDLLADELRRAGHGTLQVKRGKPSYTGCHHHLGTTRMHASPRQGVVDPTCRVHEVPNLFVAGGSVFPTGGYANPTLTIVALALRLADHLVRAGGVSAGR